MIDRGILPIDLPSRRMRRVRLPVTCGNYQPNQPRNLRQNPWRGSGIEHPADDNRALYSASTCLLALLIRTKAVSFATHFSVSALPVCEPLANSTPVGDPTRTSTGWASVSVAFQYTVTLPSPVPSHTCTGSGVAV